MNSTKTPYIVYYDVIEKFESKIFLRVSETSTLVLFPRDRTESFKDKILSYTVEKPSCWNIKNISIA